MGSKHFLLSLFLTFAVCDVLSENLHANDVSCTSCQLVYSPVCSSHGFTLMNKCLALCQHITIFTEGACKGAFNYTRSTPTHRSTELVTNKVITKYLSEGYFFTGVVHAAKGARNPKAKLSIANNLNPDDVQKMGGSRSVRITPQGHVYMEKTLASAGKGTDSGSDALGIGSQNLGSIAGEGRRLLSSGVDNRYVQYHTDQFPYSAIGQLSFQGGGYEYICSASFVSPRDILTAAHCVYDTLSTTLYSYWDFAPALNGTLAGSSKLVAYDYVHIYQQYMVDNSDVSYWDMAVIRLQSTTTTWFDLGSVAKSTIPMTTTCGYPGDKGTIDDCYLYCANCANAMPNYPDLGGLIYTGACYTYPGQSGSPLFVPSAPSIIGVLSGGPDTEYWVSYWTPMDTTHRSSVLKWIEADILPPPPTPSPPDPMQPPPPPPPPPVLPPPSLDGSNSSLKSAKPPRRPPHSRSPPPPFPPVGNLSDPTYGNLSDSSYLCAGVACNSDSEPFMASRLVIYACATLLALLLLLAQ